MYLLLNASQCMSHVVSGILVDTKVSKAVTATVVNLQRAETVVPTWIAVKEGSFIEPLKVLTFCHVIRQHSSCEDVLPAALTRTLHCGYLSDSADPMTVLGLKTWRTLRSQTPGCCTLYRASTLGFRWLSALPGCVTNNNISQIASKHKTWIILTYSTKYQKGHVCKQHTMSSYVCK